MKSYSGFDLLKFLNKETIQFKKKLTYENFIRINIIIKLMRNN